MFICSVKMAYRILQVEGRVLSCQSKPNDNRRLQKKKICDGDLLLYISRSLQSIIRFDIWLISMRYTENVLVIFYR